VLPVTWEDKWTMIGINGKAPETVEVNLPSSTHKPLVVSDDFAHQENILYDKWQWNQNPDNKLWSCTDRPGYLRLTTGYITDQVLQARNTLTQRTEGPACSGVTFMDTSNMKSGDYAGLIALQSNFGTIGVQVDSNGEKYITMTTNGENVDRIVDQKLIEHDLIHIKIAFNFIDSTDIAKFYYSVDGNDWIQFGKPLQMKYTLDHFM